MSGETKFTPGPWEIFDLDIGPSNEITVCCMSQWLDEWHAERNANAHLIAASPELYAALEAARDAWASPPSNISQDEWNAQVEHLIQVMDAALSKARGAQ